MSSAIIPIYDVFGLGAIAVDLVGTIDSWPESGTKTKLIDFKIYHGGLVGTALTAATRLGGKTAIASKLGHSILAEEALKALQKENINTDNVIRQDNDPVLSFILTQSETGERNIFFSRKNISYPLPDNFPDSKWFEKTKVLLIDHGTGIAGVNAALIARQNSVSVIIDAERVEPYIDQLLNVSDHIVVGLKFASGYTSKTNEHEMLKSLQSRENQVVVITKGEQGLIGLNHTDFFTLDAFQVDAVDTTGCGDVFHGAYALGIARGWDIKICCRFASGAAAMSAMKVGGREGIPNFMELMEFLSSHGFPMES